MMNIYYYESIYVLCVFVFLQRNGEMIFPCVFYFREEKMLEKENRKNRGVTKKK